MQKFMEMDPGVSPTQTQVRSEVWGSFCTVRNILMRLKERMLGHFQLQNHSTSLMSDSRVDTAVPDIAPHTCPDNTEFGQAKSIVQLSEAVANCLSCVKNISKNETPQVMVGNSLDYMVNTTSSEVIKIHNNQENTELGDPGSLLEFSETIEDSHGNDKKISVAAAPLEIEKHSSEDMVGKTVSEVSKMYNNLDRTEVGETVTTVQLSEVLIDSHSNKKNLSTSVISHMMREDPSVDMAQSEETPDMSKLVGPKSRHIHLTKVVADIAAVFDRDLMSKSQKFSCIEHSFLNEDTSGPFPKDGVEELTAIGNGNCQHNKKITSSGQPSSAGTEDDENLATSGSAPRVMELSDMFTRTMNNPAQGEMASQKRFALTPKRFSEDSNETSGEKVAKSSDIKFLIDFIKELPREQLISRSQDSISNQTNQVSNRGLPMKEKEVRNKDSVRRIQSCPDLQKSNSKEGITQLKSIFVDKESSTKNPEKKHCINTPCETHKENRNTGKREEVQCTDMSDGADRHHLDFEATDHVLKPYTMVPRPTSKDPNKNLDTSSIGEGAEQNKVLMRFLLKSTPKREILSALKDCGPIAKVSEFSHVKGSNFKDAYVYFETGAGLQKALKKTDLVVEDVDVIMEGTSSLEIISNRISIPDLIGDPDVPGALVKNPTRTAVIKGLTLDMSWKHLEKALSCGKGISGFIMGSSSSVAYVEFETEDAKEKAIAKHSFTVLGKCLQVFRIDAPRTTVARISNINSRKGEKKICSVCSHYGQVKNVVHRDHDTVDVHFKLAEWPSMLHILNSLNGKVVDDSQWVVQPATVYPPEILRALWSQPDGRKHVKAIIHNLLQKIAESHTDMGRLTDVAAKYYGDRL